jgi:pyruvoyl-dependent arginine decarboxylase (PvlArgDC)
MKDDNYFSDYKNYCSGYLDNPNGGHYVVLPYLGVACVQKNALPEELEKIVVFDAAQVSFANVGRINAVGVSSFIGPNARLAGFDFFKKDNFLGKISGVDSYSLDSLLDATLCVLGSIESPNYPIFSGSMVPCAMKSFYSDKEGIEIYSGLSISVPKDRKKNPFLLMEDVGFLRDDFLDYSEKIIRSSLEVCDMQGIDVDRVYVGRRGIEVERNEIACSLVMCSYVHLAAKLKREIVKRDG